MPQLFGPVEAVHKITYQSNVELATQQLTPKLMMHTTAITGLSGKEMQVVELIGSSSARRNAPHSTPTPNIAPKHAGIFVKPERLDWGRTVPKETEIKAAVDYTSKYVQEGAAAIVTGRDEIVRDAIFGPRYVRYDEDGIAVAVPFDVNRIVSKDHGAADSGLTVAKILRALRLMETAEVDLDREELVLVHSAAQNESLFNQLQVTSKDYRDRSVFEGKRVTEFMGIKFVSYQKLPLAATVRSCMLFAKSGLHAGDALPITTQVERDPGMQYQLFPYMETWLAATRSEDEKFVQINCVEAA